MKDWLCWSVVLPKEEDHQEEEHPMIEEEELPKLEMIHLKDKRPKQEVRSSSEEHVLPKMVQGHPRKGEHPIQGVLDKQWKEGMNQQEDMSSMEVVDCGWNIVKEEVPKVEEEQQQQEWLSKVLEVEASEGHWVPSECLARLQAACQPVCQLVKTTVEGGGRWEL